MKEPGSYESAYGRAREVFGRFVPGVDPARVFASMERRRGALGTFTFDEIMVHLCHYAGSPKAVDGMRAVRAAFAEIDARAAERGPRRNSNCSPPTSTGPCSTATARSTSATGGRSPSCSAAAWR